VIDALEDQVRAPAEDLTGIGASIVIL
jgi:hypothetical protein